MTSKRNNATASAKGSLAEIQKAAVDAIGKSLSATTDERTGLLRSAAKSFVDARAHFFTREGEPDWLGRTFAYRTWVREVMTQAHVPGDAITSLQASIRYHAGNILRDRLDDDQLGDLGLRQESPRERSVEKRVRLSSTLNLFGGGAALTTAEEIDQACSVIEAALARVNNDTLANMSAKDRRVARAALLRVAERAQDLAGVTK